VFDICHDVQCQFQKMRTIIHIAINEKIGSWLKSLSQTHASSRLLVITLGPLKVVWDDE
jgi:hypothetical protein